MRQKLVVLGFILLSWGFFNSQSWAQPSQEVPCPPQHPNTYCVLLKPKGFLRPFAVSPDGQLLATFWWHFQEEGTFIVLQLPQGTPLHKFSHPKNISSIAFSSDGKLLAVGTGDGKIKLWDVTTGKEVRTLDTQAFVPVRALAFSPNGKWLAFSTCERTDLKATCEQPDVGKIDL